MNKRFMTRSVLALLSLSIIGCGNLSNVSKEGTTDNPIFPKLEQSKFNSSGTQVGSWPNWENMRQIERGMNKDQLYYLLGRPHFNEGLFGVREWDYVFNYRENGEHKQCQFKVLFDKDMNAQSFYWYPNGCNGNATFTLNADLLFDFDKEALSPQGQVTMDNTIAQLKTMKTDLIRISGYTDPVGDSAYNLALSQRRADAVKAYFIAQGITSDINAVGYGEAHQVKNCQGVSGKELKACLHPNRRVEIMATGGVKQPSSNEPGTKGPSLLYKK